MDGVAQSAANVDAEVARIVAGYGDMVYAAALRQTREEALAQDVVQGVFVVLLRKVRKGAIPPESERVGWLLRTTAYVAKEARRESWRRKRRELARAATEGTAMQAEHESDLRECLDAALLTLGTLDRELVARRYLRGESVQAVAGALGVTENTASKRLGRALEKLRRTLARRGVIAPTAALTALAASEALVKMPSALAAAVESHTGRALVRRMLWRHVAARTAAAAAAAVVCIATGATVIVLHSAAVKPPVAAAQQAWKEPLVQVGAVLEQSSDWLVQQILAGIEAHRRKLKTIKIEATSSGTYYNADGTADFKTVGKGWIDATPPYRFRLEISLERSPWYDGAAPFIDDSYWETWDGQHVRILHRPPHSILRGEISDREMHASGVGILGRNYSMQLQQQIGVAAGNQETKAYLLDVKYLRNMRLAARRVIMNGREAMELEVRFRPKGPWDTFSRRYWFDAARGYALLGSEEGLDGERPLHECVVDKLTEAAPGVFYPMHAQNVSYVRMEPSHTYRLSMRSDFQATRVVANQPLPPGVFQIDFPPGVSVAQRGVAGTQPATRR